MTPRTTKHAVADGLLGVRHRLGQPSACALTAALSCIVMPLLWAVPCGAVTLAASVEESNEGYYQLTWESEEPVRLVESTDPGFGTARTLYRGADTARFVSGKPDGRWYYRLEAADAPRVVSDTVTVTVRHHSLARALGFFALGAIVFVATLALVVIGSRGRDERAQ